MATTTTTITDLPLNRALDYKARAAVKGGGGAAWVFGAFRPFPSLKRAVSSMCIDRVSLPNQRFDRELLGRNHRSMHIARHREPHANTVRNSFRVCFQALGIRAAKSERSWHSACDKKH